MARPFLRLGTKRLLSVPVEFSSSHDAAEDPVSLSDLDRVRVYKLAFLSNLLRNSLRVLFSFPDTLGGSSAMLFGGNFAAITNDVRYTYERDTAGNSEIKRLDGGESYKRCVYVKNSWVVVPVCSDDVGGGGGVGYKRWTWQHAIGAFPGVHVEYQRAYIV